MEWIRNQANIARWYADALDRNDAHLSGYYAFPLGVKDCPYQDERQKEDFWHGWRDSQQAKADATDN
jgi:ribosome modulation factor